MWHRRKVSSEDLTVKQIRYLLLEKRRAVRQSRLERFHRTGRVSAVVNEANIEGTPLSLVSRNVVQIERQRTWLDFVLLVAEFLAVIALVPIMGTFLSTLDGFNQNVAVSLQQPTLEPTPMIQAVVLPEGHTSPNNPGGARPNEAEIPEHLRPVWETFSNLPTPVPAKTARISNDVDICDCHLSARSG